jgi:biopolymer transport protein ExbD
MPFKKKKKIEMPPLSTASLPDIVFMLLFFFMVTTTMREVTLLVKLKKPQATEIQKLERKDLTTYIYIGAPKSAALGNEPRIQLADQLASVGDVQQWVILQREEVNEAERAKFTVSIKSDIDAKMGLISDIKQELRKAQALKLSYSANPASSPEDMFKAYR